MMLGIALIGAAGAVGRNYFAGHISQTIGKEMRSELYRKIQSFSFENIDHLETARLLRVLLMMWLRFKTSLMAVCEY